jgi:hypothetical protein
MWWVWRSIAIEPAVEISEVSGGNFEEGLRIEWALLGS